MAYGLICSLGGIDMIINASIKIAPGAEPPVPFRHQESMPPNHSHESQPRTELSLSAARQPRVFLGTIGSPTPRRLLLTHGASPCSRRNWIMKRLSTGSDYHPRESQILSMSVRVLNPVSDLIIAGFAGRLVVGLFYNIWSANFPIRGDLTMNSVSVP